MTNLHESIMSGDDKEKVAITHVEETIRSGNVWESCSAFRFCAFEQPFCCKPHELVLFGLGVVFKIFLLPVIKRITMLSLSDKQMSNLITFNQVD